MGSYSHACAVVQSEPAVLSMRVEGCTEPRRGGQVAAGRVGWGWGAKIIHF